MNVRLLRRIEREIKKEPRRFNMNDWVDTNASESLAKKFVPPCNTTACIAGWATLLSHKYKKDDAPDLPLPKTFRQKAEHLQEISEYYEGVGQQALALTENQALNLFFVDYWPEPYQTEHRFAKTPEGKAKVAIARIEHFIKTKGRE